MFFEIDILMNSTLSGIVLSKNVAQFHPIIKIAVLSNRKIDYKHTMCTMHIKTYIHANLGAYRGSVNVVIHDFGLLFLASVGDWCHLRFLMHLILQNTNKMLQTLGTFFMWMEP